MFHNKMFTINYFLVNCTDYWAISNKTVFLHFLTQAMYKFFFGVLCTYHFSDKSMNAHIK